ncbi:hypothetical protein GA0070622_5646 [Micromonospora sediminicola]|uniref:Uncharacterized protein n=1 Tax=Micromonospora sediminicola TaxID=946078 RepID=A0A1A9BHJ2_9ACTN|nr:hypothetical protein GA0070622_5646 [Micromonospora sediminicola]
MGTGLLNRWYMYWPASVNRDMVAVPPEPIAVPGPLSQLAVSTVVESVPALDFTSMLSKSWLSRVVNHSARSTVRVSVVAVAAVAARMAAERSAMFCA